MYHACHIFILNALADLYLDQGRYSQSIQLYRDVINLNPDDPWAWHDMSIVFVHMKKFKEAKVCNQRALDIMDFEAARDIQRLIEKKRSGGLKRLIGR